ncbi:MAG TPA: exodeoxyribonuclease VII large subunit [Candidatus Blautia faecigallinarum]|uniref:Exodeoxyribonuclease 7 large subunit n=1 Tax=Candidatus Blautia faecigallinarum TaxID=2838488 RepID=A0A9D2DRT2_9FIRM|nr:exodeoxyribonuclease VII large subunit [Candidatus Blautia faecigallinarum]
MLKNRVYSVGQVNRYVKNMFVQDFFLQKLAVKGEVSNLKYHTSGHIYFSLKDETGVLSCVMFAGNRRGLSFRMKDGDKIIAKGTVDVYERDGRYQLYVKEITLEGAGALYERFLALKQELEEMGMFAQEYKQPIPRFIKKLGVVTAPTGAAVQDIRNISLRRNPFLQIILYPALVQGEGAADSIVKGIRMLDEAGVDVIIIGRGGGSIEDLWAFNEEKVARAIFECQTPIISAVGHETDFTIADFAADLRAPTPSAAAELAVDDYRSVLETAGAFRERIQRAMQNRMELYKSKMSQYQMRMQYLSPQSRLREMRQYLADLEEKMQAGMEGKLFDRRSRLSIYLEKFQGLSPLRKLNQGFSYVSNEKNHTVTSIKEVTPGEILNIAVTDGEIRASVQEIREEKRI